MKTVYLMRHGALKTPAQKVFIGQSDVPLSDRGRKQALFWRQELESVPIDAIVSSDLRRCQETASLIAGQRGIPIRYESCLREICLGTWEGRPVAQVQEHFPEAYAQRGRDLAGFRPDQGESFEDLASRVLPVFERVVTSCLGDRLLIVAHAGVNRVILANILALPLRHVLEIPQPYGCCTILPIGARPQTQLGCRPRPAWGEGFPQDPL